MSPSRSKPQGASGAVGIGSGVVWNVIPFPEAKDERERLVAELFVGGFERWVAMQSEPSLAPFGKPSQNPENDLDFVIETAAGTKLMELTEFAPLADHGPTFADAPKEMSPNEKAPLAAQLIRMKSQHQGGADRILLVYATEHGFWLDPITIEILRRDLANGPPNFDRVYYVSLHDLQSASVTEIFPGKPHHIFGDKTDEQLAAFAASATLPHPAKMEVRHILRGKIGAKFGSTPVILDFTINMPGMLTVRRGSSR